MNNQTNASMLKNLGRIQFFEVIEKGKLKGRRLGLLQNIRNQIAKTNIWKAHLEKTKIKEPVVVEKWDDSVKLPL